MRQAAVKCLAVCAAALMASACSSDASTPWGTENAIWPSNATEMVLTNSGGGFAPPAPTGSECQSGEDTFTLTVATRNFAWKECQGSGSDPYLFVSDQRVLSQAEFDGVVEALRAVTVSTRTGCGADKGSLTLTVTTPTGDHQYLDDFYACNHAGTYVSGLDEVFQASQNLAH